jgi:hypothetical protein
LSEYVLHKPFHLEGMWWVPLHDSAPPDKKAGTLSFSPDNGLTLSLHGGLDTDPTALSARPIPIVLGKVPGAVVTLQDCFTVHASFGISMEAHESSMWAARAFIGAHFDTPDEIRFERVSATLEHLGAWLWTKAFDIRHDWSSRTHTVTMKPPEPVVVPLPNGGKAGIAYSSAGPNWDISEGRVAAQVTPHFVYHPPEPSSIDLLWKEIRHFQHFLSMAVGCPCAMTSISGLRTPLSAEPNENPLARTVAVIFKPRELPGGNRPKHPAQMVFSFAEIEPSLEKYLAKWYSADEDLRVVQNLYFSTRYETHMLIDNMFLHVVQALESFHRLRFNRSPMDHIEFKAKARELLEPLPQGEFRNLAGRALAFANELSLYDRLVELADKYGRVVTGAYGAGRDDFLRKVKKTRDYHVHFDPEDKKGILEGAELLHAYRLLRVVMEACFMAEMGMETTEVLHRLSEKADYFV